MKLNTITMTATTPAFVMSSYGHPCAQERTLGAVAAGIRAAVVRVKGDFWALPPGGQPSS